MKDEWKTAVSRALLALIQEVHHLSHGQLDLTDVDLTPVIKQAHYGVSRTELERKVLEAPFSLIEDDNERD